MRTPHQTSSQAIVGKRPRPHATPTRGHAHAERAPARAEHTLPVACHESAPPAARTESPAAAPAESALRIGVGIDTSRYGHYAAFLRGDLDPADEELMFAESADGYAQLGERLQRIGQKYGPIELAIRIDAAGPYAQNLDAFLRTLLGEIAISYGDPLRNKNYRVALFGPKKADPIEAKAAARFAITERPKPTPPTPPELHTLREIASRLESHTRQITRLVNQLHNLLARVFPELAVVVSDLSAVWVLELLARYPTPQRIAAARRRSLEAVRYLPHDAIDTLLHWAKQSVASLTGANAETLVTMQVAQLRDALGFKKRLETLLISAYRALPFDNQLATIKGIGEVTAAVLTAKIVAIDRFATPGKLVSYFGIYPIEFASGVDRDGKLREPKRLVMSQRGSDLVRRYLWMAALTAIVYNPAVRALYQRRAATLQDGQKGIAIGHAMRKLLHQVWAVWTSGQPFDPEHDVPQSAPAAGEPSPGSAAPRAADAAHETSAAAGRNRQLCPEKPAVSAASCTRVAACVGNDHPERGDAADRSQQTRRSEAPASTPRAARPARRGPWIDFGHLRSQLPLERVLRESGHLDPLKGRGPQRRGPCPLHESGPRDRSFSVNLGENRFHCFDLGCGARGDVIDFWAAVHGLSLREAALDLVQRFGLEPCPGSSSPGNREVGHA